MFRLITFSVVVVLLQALCCQSLVPQIYQNARPRSQQRRTMTMLDSNVVTGVAVGVAGFGSGIALAYFAENQIVRAEQRGSDVLSDSTKAKMSAMFMEDEVMPETGLDETVRRMEEALAKAKGEDATEEKKEEESERPAKVPKDDGW